MADTFETDPFLDDNDHVASHDGTKSHSVESSPTIPYIKIGIKILRVIILCLSVAVLALLIPTYILIKTGPFKYTLAAEELVRHLAICVRYFSLYLSCRGKSFRLLQRSYAYHAVIASRKRHLLRSNDLFTNPNHSQYSCEYCDADRDLCLLRQVVWGRQDVLQLLPARDNGMCTRKAFHYGRDGL